MAESTLFTIACEMLRETSPYKKDISEIFYRLGSQEISMLDILERKLSLYRAGTRNYSKQNLYVAYKNISETMVEYLEDFHSSFSFKQRIKIKFRYWLKSIQEKYSLDDFDLPPELEIKCSDQDTCITMLKELHSRTGVTKDDLCYKLDLKPRAVQKNLRKLSPDLYEGEKEDISNEAEYVPFRIGGQPVKTAIMIKNKGDKKKYYYTPNTIHPIVLQENLMQVGTLLLSLCRNYYDYESNISLLIAADIWSQLSDYAKDKLCNLCLFRDQESREFIEILKDECPDDYMSTYQTEREMAVKEDLSIEEQLLYLEKVPERIANIVINKNGSRTFISGVHLIRVMDTAFIVEDSEQNRQTIEIDNVIDIAFE